MVIRVKRVYDPPERSDGKRILVDRLWPRGLSKDKARIDLWMKEIAPSTGLRTWYGHDPGKWNDFRERYFIELNANPLAVQELLDHAQSGPVTFVFTAREHTLNNAEALKEYIDEMDRKAGGKTP